MFYKTINGLFKKYFGLDFQSQRDYVFIELAILSAAFDSLGFE